MRSQFKFEYALRYPNGTYYNGNEVGGNTPEVYQGTKNQAYTYTVEGAWKKKQQHVFAECSIIHVI